MKYYELNYLISEHFSEKEVKELIEKINSYIEKEGGVLVKINKSIKKDLAFPIQKNSQAYLVTNEFNFPPEKLENLEKKLKKEKAIIRYLLIKKKTTKAVTLKKPLKTIKKIEKPKVEMEELEKKLEEILDKDNESQ